MATSGSIWKETVDIIMIIAVTVRSIRITETMATTMATADSTSTSD
jgi:hypothetical protein